MEYISPSRIHTYNSCALSFKFRYIEKMTEIDETTDWYADYGTLIHDISENIAKGDISSVEMAQHKFDEVFPHIAIPEKNRPTYYKQGKQAVDSIFQELSGLEIVGVEKEFNAYIDFSMPKLYGFIDLVYRDEKGRLIVRDYKSSRVYDKSTMDKQFQPYVYALACKELYGEYPYMFEFDFVRFGEKKQIIINEPFVQMGKIKILGFWNKVKNEEFEPTYNPFYCQNFCGFRSLCPVYLKKGGR